MAGRVVASVLALGVCAAPFGAAAVEQALPLRTLTYSFELSIADTVDIPGATLSGGPRPVTTVKGRVVARSGPVSGSGDSHSGIKVAAKGSITVEVLHATDDSGLVVAISEDGLNRVRPQVKVGIAADGGLLYDPARAGDLSEEEVAVVHWLGRGFYGDHPRDIGTSWTVDQSVNGRIDVERYRVVARDDPRVTLQFALDERSNRAGGYTGSREGSLVYDTAMVVPVKAAFDSIARRQSGDSYTTLRSSIRLELAADTFARAK